MPVCCAAPVPQLPALLWACVPEHIYCWLAETPCRPQVLLRLVQAVGLFGMPLSKGKVPSALCLGRIAWLTSGQQAHRQSQEDHFQSLGMLKL